MSSENIRIKVYLIHKDADTSYNFKNLCQNPLFETVRQFVWKKPSAFLSPFHELQKSLTKLFPQLIPGEFEILFLDRTDFVLIKEDEELDLYIQDMLKSDEKCVLYVHQQPSKITDDYTTVLTPERFLELPPQREKVDGQQKIPLGNDEGLLQTIESTNCSLEEEGSSTESKESKNADTKKKMIATESEEIGIKQSVAEKDIDPQKSAAVETLRPAADVHHFGVVCDGCDKSIYGTRWKCLQCPDYDLCDECDKKHIHDNHVMARVYHPVKRGFWCKVIPAPGVSCREPLDNLFKNIWNGLSESDNSSGACDANVGPSPPAFENFTNPSNYEDYLKNVGKYVSDVLDPLGIDVDIEVRRNKECKDEPVAETDHTDKKGEEDPLSAKDVDKPENSGDKKSPLFPSSSSNKSLSGKEDEPQQNSDDKQQSPPVGLIGSSDSEESFEKIDEEISNTNVSMDRNAEASGGELKDDTKETKTHSDSLKNEVKTQEPTKADVTESTSQDSHFNEIEDSANVESDQVNDATRKVTPNESGVEFPGWVYLNAVAGRPSYPYPCDGLYPKLESTSGESSKIPTSCDKLKTESTPGISSNPPLSHNVLNDVADMAANMARRAIISNGIVSNPHGAQTPGNVNTSYSSKTSEPKVNVQKQLQQMMDMGFSNDNGWLERLLISVNGDISCALDTLHPH